MQKRKIYKRFIDLPQGVQDFFMETADTVYSDLIEKHNLSQEHFFDVVETPILNTTLGFKSVPDGLNILFKNLIAANVPQESQKVIIKTLLEKVFWPLRDLFGIELTSYLDELSVRYASWPQERVLFKPVSYSGAVSEIVARLGMHSLGKQARTSLRDLIAKYSKGELVPDQIKETLIRLPEFGGLGFDKDTAEKALKEIQELSKQVEFLSEEDYAEHLTSKTVKMDGSSKAEGEVSADDEEIQTIRSQMPPVPKVMTELDKAVEDAWNKIKNKPTNDYLERRLRNVISSRLRDVRNTQELMQLLQRETKVGGLGLDRDAAKLIADVIEQTYTDFHGNIKAEEQKKLEKQLTEQKRKIEERRRLEAEEHAKWYKEKIKSKQESKEEQKQLAEALKKGLAANPVQKSHVMEAGAAVLKKKYGDMVAAPVKVGAMAGKGFSASAPVSNRGVKVSASTAKIAPVYKAPVDGVKAAPKLRGLVGELESMTMSQFRRLAQAPGDATNKILEKMETLKQESFEQKVAGVRAWQDSPIMKVYLGLITESFKTRKPLVQIAEEKRKAGEDTLTSDEIEALVALNNKLHY
ncbi:MAG: hypothetical protein P1P90_06710 [Patescibacteria group bacterium]|nr:hypothetical protein [Patescibacteria group bacterium]